MMQEHMNAEECSALGSTPFMLIVSFPYVLLFFVTSALFSLHLNTNKMQCFLVFLWLMLFLNIYCSMIVTKNIIRITFIYKILR